MRSISESKQVAWVWIKPAGWNHGRHRLDDVPRAVNVREFAPTCDTWHHLGQAWADCGATSRRRVLAMFACCTKPQIEEEVSVRRPKEALGKAWWAKNVIFAIMEDRAVH